MKAISGLLAIIGGILVYCAFVGIPLGLIAGVVAALIAGTGFFGGLLTGAGYAVMSAASALVLAGLTAVTASYAVS